jgi:hypothetical protein
MDSKLAYVMRSTLDYFKLGMHVEIKTNLAKLSKKHKRKRSSLKLAKIRQKGKECKPLGYNSFELALQ